MKHTLTTAELAALVEGAGAPIIARELRNLADEAPSIGAAWQRAEGAAIAVKDCAAHLRGEQSPSLTDEQREALDDATPGMSYGLTSEEAATMAQKAADKAQRGTTVRVEAGILSYIRTGDDSNISSAVLDALTSWGGADDIAAALLAYLSGDPHDLPAGIVESLGVWRDEATGDAIDEVEADVRAVLKGGDGPSLAEPLIATLRTLRPTAQPARDPAKVGPPCGDCASKRAAVGVDPYDGPCPHTPAPSGGAADAEDTWLQPGAPEGLL